MTERESLIAQITDNEARFRALTELSSDWYWEMDEQLRFTRLRRGQRDTFNLEDEEIIGKYSWELPGELIRPSSWDEHRATLLARKPFRDVMFRRWMPDGSFAYSVTSGDPIYSAEGKFIGYRGIGKNITEQVKSQERIERLATVDELTQLSNRQTFDERAGRILANAYAVRSAAHCCLSIWITSDCLTTATVIASAIRCWRLSRAGFATQLRSRIWSAAAAVTNWLRCWSTFRAVNMRSTWRRS